jgi:nucleoside-diphosphate-sugar epimerase
MNVALTGASGFIGSRIAVHLHKAGHTVTGLVRETSRREHLSGVVDRFVVGDHADESCWDELWEGAEVSNIQYLFYTESPNKNQFDKYVSYNLLKIGC